MIMVMKLGRRLFPRSSFVVFFFTHAKIILPSREPLMMSSKHYNNGIMVWMGGGADYVLGMICVPESLGGSPRAIGVQVLRSSSALLRVQLLTRFYGVTFRNNFNALLLVYSSGEWQCLALASWGPWISFWLMRPTGHVCIMEFCPFPGRWSRLLWFCWISRVRVWLKVWL